MANDEFVLEFLPDKDGPDVSRSTCNTKNGEEKLVQSEYT